MTEKQKEAVELICDLKLKEAVTKEQFFMLMEFVMESPTKIEYIPQINPSPWTSGPMVLGDEGKIVM